MNILCSYEDAFFYAGKSQAVVGGEKIHREHLVPCVLLYAEVRRLLGENVEKEKIAAYLAKHWKVAHISKEEADCLDLKSELNLKTRG